MYFPPQLQPYEAGGRLTLTTATPVMTTSTSAQTTIFYTPYKHQYVPIYDGVSIKMVDVGGELSQLTTDATKSPAAVAASSVYDLFVWNDAGTFRCTRGAVWTNDTTRAAGLTRQNGVLLNTSTVTNGPAALRGTYVGTVRSNGSSQIDYIFGGNGSAGFFGVWNLFNRIDVITTANDTTASWTYSVNTPRQINNAALCRVTFVSGLAEDCIDSTYQCTISLIAASSSAYIGVALDSTAGTDRRNSFSNNAATALGVSPSVRNAYAPQLGVHFITGIESSDGTNNNVFNGLTFHGLTVKLRT